jgi:hypothetical protein
MACQTCDSNRLLADSYYEEIEYLKYKLAKNEDEEYVLVCKNEVPWTFRYRFLSVVNWIRLRIMRLNPV